MNSEQIHKYLLKKIDELTKNALNKVVEYATNQAQRSYERFMIEIPADDPYIFVVNTPLVQNNTTYSRSIKAVGNQVLFVEFGAGKYYNTNPSNITHLYQGFMPNDRPSTIYDIGGYGKHRGLDDVWFYKSQNGRESENAHLIKYNRNGDPIMITHGNRPARALYLGVGNAIRRLLGGKLK